MIRLILRVNSAGVGFTLARHGGTTSLAASVLGEGGKKGDPGGAGGVISRQTSCLAPQSRTSAIFMRLSTQFTVVFLGYSGLLGQKYVYPFTCVLPSRAILRPFPKKLLKNLRARKRYVDINVARDGAKSLPGIALRSARAQSSRHASSTH